MSTGNLRKQESLRCIHTSHENRALSMDGSIHIRRWLPILFILAFFVLCYRARGGYFYYDEPFLITLAQRLYNGDRLIFDEWHVSQSVAPLLLPFYSMYVGLTGSTEGIMLAFRFIYCLMWTTVCYVVCKTLMRETAVLNMGKHRMLSVIWATLYLLLFSPLDYMTLSYTSIGLSSALVILCLILSCTPTFRISPKAAGILLAILACIQVVCCPYMGLAVVAGTAAVWIIVLNRKEKVQKAAKNCLVWFTCSVPVFFILYCLCFILREKDIALLLPCLRAILQDPQHPRISLPVGLFTLALNLAKKCAQYSVILLSSAFLIILFPKWAHRYRCAIFLFCCAGYGFAMIQCVTWWFQALNYQMIDIAMLGFISYLLLQKKPKKLFWSFYVYGLVYTVCNYFGSNTGIFSVGMTLSVCGTAGIVFILLLCRELADEYKDKRPVQQGIAFLAAILILTQLGAQGYLKVTRQYRDRPLEFHSESISMGAGKGIFTRLGYKTQYEKNYHNLKELLQTASVKEGSRFVCLAPKDVAFYLDAQLPIGTFSSWIFGFYENEMLTDRMEEYIHLGHEPPDVLFCSSEKMLPPDFCRDGYEVYTKDKAVLFVRKA